LDLVPTKSVLAANMQIKKLLSFMFLLALLVLFVLWLRNEVRIDSCLDRGGRWDDSKQLCEGATE